MKWYLLILCPLLSFAQSKPEPAERLLNLKKQRSSARARKMGAPLQIDEASGLAWWNGRLWTHNDSGDTKLFALDTLGIIRETYDLPGVTNRDWEDLDQDGDYFYLGNFGNNRHNVDTLEILRISKMGLLQKKPQIQKIRFVWPETKTEGLIEKVNFDCEAMAVIGDSVCLFTKEWKVGHRTRLFTLPKTPGIWTANYQSTLKTRLLVTGASYDSVSQRLVLCGYNLTLRPMLLVFDASDGLHFFDHPYQKIRFRRRFGQVEGVAWRQPGIVFAVSEDFKMAFLHKRPRLFRLQLKPLKTKKP